MERPKSVQNVLKLLQEGISSATHEKPFCIALQNSRFVSFDSLNGLIPQKVQALDLIKRDKRRKTSDYLLVRLGPYLTGEMTYACFPLTAITTKDNRLTIDCTAVVKEKVFTTLANFFTQKPLN